MSGIQVGNVLGKAEDIWDQLEKSWPKTMDKIMNEYKHEGQEFYIFTFFKWNTHIIPATYNVYHQPRKSRPDAIPGTVLRKISPKNGTAEILWALPHKEGFELYKEGKMFADPIVHESIRRFLAGELEEKGEFSRV